MNNKKNIITFKNASLIDEMETVFFSGVSININKKDIVYVSGGNENLCFLNLCAGLTPSLSSGDFEFKNEFKPVFIYHGFKYFEEFKPDNLLKIVCKFKSSTVSLKEALDIRKSLGIRNIKLSKMNFGEKILFKLCFSFISGFKVFVLEQPFLETAKENQLVINLIKKYSQFGVFIIKSPVDKASLIANKIIIFDNKNKMKACFDLNNTLISEFKLSKPVKIRRIFSAGDKIFTFPDRKNEIEKITGKSGIKIISKIDRKPTLTEIENIVRMES
ncbi:MAG: hypothetical protein ACQESP_02790 [Candidatus Muiribacteriota bacterium]